MLTTNPSVLGVGFGPANLSLAVTLRERGFRGPTRFIERAAEFQWQRELMLTGTDIQNSPFRDLAMVRDTRSPYTFVNYLAAHGRLTEYLHLAAKFPLRREYAHYLEWVSRSFSATVDYGRGVREIGIDLHRGREQWLVEVDDGDVRAGEVLVMGTGRSPRVPRQFEPYLGRTVFHSSRFLSSMQSIAGRGLRVAVVGASQSAIEIVLELLDDARVGSVTSIQRGLGFRLKDTSPYSRRVFLPEFVDYFHPLPPQRKRELRRDLRSINYAACDADVIERLAVKQYEYGLQGVDRFGLRTYSDVVGMTPLGRGAHRLTLKDVNYGTLSGIDADVVVMATGFRDFGTGPDDEICHPLLSSISHRLAREEDGTLAVARDYSVAVTGRSGRAGPALFVNGLCEATHGMGDAGALAMLSTRSVDIAAAIEALSVVTGSGDASEPLAVTGST